MHYAYAIVIVDGNTHTHLAISITDGRVAIQSRGKLSFCAITRSTWKNIVLYACMSNCKRTTKITHSQDQVLKLVKKTYMVTLRSKAIRIMWTEIHNLMHLQFTWLDCSFLLDCLVIRNSKIYLYALSHVCRSRRSSRRDVLMFVVVLAVDIRKVLPHFFLAALAWLQLELEMKFARSGALGRVRIINFILCLLCCCL